MSNNCGRCGKQVYQAEEVVAASKKWHKRGCFTCNQVDCRKSLQQNFVKVHKGEIYCEGLQRFSNSPNHELYSYKNK